MINDVNDNEGNYAVGLTEATLFEFVRPEQETAPGGEVKCPGSV